MMEKLVGKDTNKSPKIKILLVKASNEMGYDGKVGGEMVPPKIAKGAHMIYDGRILRHNRNTDLKKGLISNNDAILLMLGKWEADGHGRLDRGSIMAGLKEIHPEMKRWHRGTLVSYTTTDASRLLGSPRVAKGKGGAWYARSGRGYYALTEAGRRRLDEITDPDA